MGKNVELSEFINYIKGQVRKSEEPKPSEGFWIGASSLEISFETITEFKKGGGLKIFIISAEGEKKNKIVQKVKINLVTQDFKPRKGYVDVFNPRK